MRFTQAYAHSAVCSATRFALMTGRYQYRLRGGLEEPMVRADRSSPAPAHDAEPLQPIAPGELYAFAQGKLVYRG